MSESSDKRRKIYVDCPKGESKTCIINVPGYSLDEWKILRDFGSNYIKSRLTKYRGNDTVPINKFNRHKENNDIVNSAVNEILLHETEKLIAVKKAP